MTAQIHETLILDGARTSMAFCPPLPHAHPRVVAVGVNEQTEETRWLASSTACWRRYVGTWEVRDDRLFLVGLTGAYTLVGADPLFADWFTGVLRVPRGRELESVHMGFGSLYEEELHLRVEEGIVTGRRQIDNRGKQIDRWNVGLENLPGGENDFDGDDFWD
jgi:hypothetical protein